MVPETAKAEPLAIRDCALSAIATGTKAQNLRELLTYLQTIHPGSIYYHFWGRLLRPQLEEPEYNNDFAIWARRGLKDRQLAERLGMIDPADFATLEELRQELIEVVEERLYERDHVPWSKSDQQFHFIRCQIVVFETPIRIRVPEELPLFVPHLSVSSIFYHFIEARRHMAGISWQKGMDDFRAWLQGFNSQYNDLCRQLATIDPYFTSLMELRRTLATIFSDYFQREKS